MADDHTVGGLVRKRAELTGEIEAAPRDYQTPTKNILKAELKRRGVTYRGLAERLSTIGVHETERNIANKISRGGFSAAFFVECLTIIGCNHLRLNDS